uniref:Uncharacterized protein MANES_02G061300 n=1 Tax=Rhizophora mucronata TaxID=61149 RepID=A0A2P2MDP0_RHIMU
MGYRYSSLFSFIRNSKCFLFSLLHRQGTWLFRICQCWCHQSNGQVMTKGHICSYHRMSCEPVVVDNNVKQ